jgi:hypothetical protein
MSPCRFLAVALVVLSSLSAAERWHKARLASQIFLAVAATADLGSSVGLRETNPVAGPSSRFGSRQGAVLG